MPNTPPPAIQEPRSSKPRYLLEAIVLSCVAVVAACAGIADHSPEWNKACLIIAVIFMIPMCWAAERTLDTSAAAHPRD